MTVSQPRILIIEDHAEVRRMLRTGIEALGPEMKVIDVPSAEEAMLVLTRQKVDLLVTDIHLPGISGLELKQKARKRSPEMKLILITGVTDPQVRNQVAEAGADAYFFKPLQLSEFLLQVEELLGRGKPAAKPSTAPLNPPNEDLAAQLLTKALQKLDAAWIVWFDLKGKVLARAGRFSGSTLDSNLAPVILGNLTALTSLGRFFDSQSAQDFLLVRAPEIRLMLGHVGTTTALLAAISGAPDERRLEQEFRIFRKAVAALASASPVVRGSAGKPSASAQKPQGKPAPTTPPRQPAPAAAQEARALAELLQKAAVKQVLPEDVDAFWDAIADDDVKAEPSNRDTIPFEEAQRLGLAPEE